ncbi:MAG TPA: hypothetical protein VFE05_07975, partial [Longimicrobiaceae bacterium]|nr:hypothetical protein [Longimicrobiaceae bacterium]
TLRSDHTAEDSPDKHASRTEDSANTCANSHSSDSIPLPIICSPHGGQRRALEPVGVADRPRRAMLL